MKSLKFLNLKTKIQIRQKVNLEPENPYVISQIVKYLQKEMVTVSCQYKIMLFCLVLYSLFLSLSLQEPQNSNLYLLYHCIVKRTRNDNGEKSTTNTLLDLRLEILRVAQYFQRPIRRLRGKIQATSKILSAPINSLSIE